jgi:hypothetical protein
MPSHAIPPGREGRAQRKRARRSRLVGAWHRLPVLLLLLTVGQVAGMLSPQSTVMGLGLAVLRAVLVGTVMAVLIAVYAVVLGPRMNAWRAPASAPRPRWQYALAALGWAGIACGFALLSLWIGAGLTARAAAALSFWSGIYGLVLMGRAACWGRVRALLWWDLLPAPQAPAGRNLAGRRRV